MSSLRLNSQEWKLFIRLLIGCLWGSLAVIPYLFQLQSLSVQLLPAQVLKTVANVLIIFPILIYLGILVKRRVPLAGAPILENAEAIPFRNLIVYGLGVGLLSGFVIVFGDWLFAQGGNSAIATLNSKHPNAWTGVLASFYGGIVEETSLRFFFMALLVLLLKRLGNFGIWSAIFLSAIVFGAAHLPTLLKTLHLTNLRDVPGILLAREIILNSVVGISCGWLYWKKGIEYAMLSHFGADIVIHVLFAVT